MYSFRGPSANGASKDWWRWRLFHGSSASMMSPLSCRVFHVGCRFSVWATSLYILGQVTGSTGTSRIDIVPSITPL
eukprot:12947842-Ditylum_brightwellii.AAC.1